MSTVICPLYRQGMGAQRSWACTEVPAEGREAGALQGPPLTLSCLGYDGAVVGVGRPGPLRHLLQSRATELAPGSPQTDVREKQTLILSGAVAAEVNSNESC